MKSAPPIVQLRGMFGRIFEEWVNVGECESWGWVDLDVGYGNLRAWMQNNPLVWQTEVLTFSTTDWANIYTRGQLTIHGMLKLLTIICYSVLVSSKKE